MEKDFELFWQSYPRKVGKLLAKRQFKRVYHELPPIAELLSIIDKHKKQEQWRKDGGAFIPHPSTWLNQGRWMDEIEVKLIDNSGNLVDWWETSTGIEAKGRSLGIKPEQFDNFQYFKAAVMHRVRESQNGPA